MTTSASAFQEEPDSVVQIRPILVRVLGSAIGTQAPYPISVITGSELTRGTASAFLEDALRAVPGVQIHNRFNMAVGERIAVRGFGSRSQFGVRGVRVLVDGIPATLARWAGDARSPGLGRTRTGRGAARTQRRALRQCGGWGPALPVDRSESGAAIRFASCDWRIPRPLDDPSECHRNAAGAASYRVGFTRTDFDGFRRNPEVDDGSAYGAATRSVLNSTLSLPVGQGTLRFVANGVDLDAENPGSLNTDGSR